MPHCPRHAWLTLAHAAPAAPLTWAALKRLDPDTACLGERLAATLDGDDAAFADLQVDERSARLPARLLARLRHPDVARAVEQALQRCAQQPRHHLLTPADPNWPPRVAAIDDPPPMLSLVGEPAALDPPAVAIVGARQASRVGLESAHALGRGLTDAGIAVVSGLAIGIDAAAHEGALAGGGITLAIMATGTDRIYPARHAALAERILERGALVTEFPLGTPVEKAHFPLRNRLGSALSHGVVLVEAAERSGTLTTAAHARAQNREVMVVPGRLASPANAGGHALLSDGATLVLHPEHVVQTVLPAIRQELIGLQRDTATQSPLPTPPPAPALARPERRVLARLDAEPIGVDRLGSLCGLSAPKLLAALGELELSGLARRDVDGRYSRCFAPQAGGASRAADDDPDRREFTALDARPRFELD